MNIKLYSWSNFLNFFFLKNLISLSNFSKETPRKAFMVLIIEENPRCTLPPKHKDGNPKDHSSNGEKLEKHLDQFNTACQPCVTL